MRDFLARFVKDDNGAAAVEYGLLVAAIAAIIILTVFYLGGYVEAAFKFTCNSFASDTSLTNTAPGAC